MFVYTHENSVYSAKRENDVNAGEDDEHSFGKSLISSKTGKNCKLFRVDIKSVLLRRFSRFVHSARTFIDCESSAA